MKMKIFIYGITGIGKTTYSKRLAQENNLEYISGDDIKEKIYLSGESAKNDKYIHHKASAKQAWRNDGANSIVGMRKGINSFVKKYLSGKDNFVFDSAYLDPKMFMNEGEVYLLVCLDVDEHRSRLFGRDIHKTHDENIERLSIARTVQSWFIEEAKGLGIQTINICSKR